MDSHDMASGDMPCATGTVDCSIRDDFNHDGRTVQLKLNDPPNDVPVVINAVETLTPAAQPIDLVGMCPTRSPPPGDSPPLNVLYCIYLD